MDNNKKYSTIDLHHHSKYSFEAPKATLNVKDILDYYRQLAETKYDRVIENGQERLINKKVAFSIADHNSSEGSWYAWQLINKNPERYKNIEVIPGIELSVDCGKVLTYPDERNSDEKYVFKGMHLLAHAKKGREEEFFKRTWVISMLNRMVIDPQNAYIYKKDVVAQSNEEKQYKYISIGGQILSARNLIANKYGVKIPYDDLKPCIKEGATYQQIRNIFIYVCYKHLSKNSNKFKKMQEFQVKREISRAISSNPNKDNIYQPIFPKKPMVVKDLHNLNKIDILEVPKILGDCATTCFAHPYTLEIHSHTPIAVRDFKNVDLSTLPQNVQNRIKRKLNNPREANGFFTPQEILGRGRYGFKIMGDRPNLVAFQILNNKLLEKGVKIDGFEITHHYDVVKSIPAVLDLTVDKYGLKLSFGTDVHFGEDDKHFFKDMVDQAPDPKRQSYFSYHSMFATESSYFKLNRLGAENLKEEDNEITITFK